MYFLDKTFPSPAENLACDEALLLMCEQGYDGEIFRIWEPHTHFVVLGYGNSARSEIDFDGCHRHGVTIFRRYSGGGAVVQGPGCVNYSLILRTSPTGPLSTITGTTRRVMTVNAAALRPLITGTVSVKGTSDLTTDGVKFSGNAQRRMHRSVLFHGTFLLDFDIPLVDAVLRIPNRQPAYRKNRPHREFLCNIPVSRAALRDALQTAWAATEKLPRLPDEAIRRLAQDRYSSDAWTYRR